MPTLRLTGKLITLDIPNAGQPSIESAMKHKLTPATLQFEKAHSCAILTCDFSQATKKVMPKLYIQSMDAYVFQREYSLAKRHRAGDSKEIYWESHIYQHPGRRQICEVSEKVAVAFIARFMEQVEKYPSLLFNETSERRACNEGFVRLAETLHRGASPSITLL